MSQRCIADQWKDYELYMTGDGQKKERWGDYLLKRPDPQAIWPVNMPWGKVHAEYHRSQKGGGNWEYKESLPKQWIIQYKSLRFNVQPTGFKHTGLFPEQAVNWDYMMDVIPKAKKNIRVLNLFAYTGGATVACAYAGASVVHIDASKGMVHNAKQNLELSGLKDRPVRFLVDDVLKFVSREIRRKNQYDAIIMDPPAYGRGPSGEMWKIEDQLYELMKKCKQLLSPDPLFFMVNSYTGTVTPILIENIFQLLFQDQQGKVTSYELALKASQQNVILPCGFTVRWENQ